MKNKNDLEKEFIKIIKMNDILMEVLKYLDRIDIPNYYVISGSLFQMVWNYYDGKNLTHAIKDLDIIYYDEKHLSYEDEKNLEDRVISDLSKRGITLELDIHNEARAHLWKKENENPNIDRYDCSEDAIKQLTATVQATGVRMIDGKISIYAPYGLDDIFTRTIRPINHANNSKYLYMKKASSWKDRFDNLIIIEWR